MKATKYSILKKETYTDKKGEVQTIYHNIGTLTEFTHDDGGISRMIEIPAISLKANAYPIEKKSDKPKEQTNEVNVDGIPF